MPNEAVFPLEGLTKRFGDAAPLVENGLSFNQEELVSPTPKGETPEKVSETIGLDGPQGMSQRRTSESGGRKHRAALARTAPTRPRPEPLDDGRNGPYPESDHENTIRNDRKYLIRPPIDDFVACPTGLMDTLCTTKW